jgi:thiol-disulfide isomerase/thioredoxin
MIKILIAILYFKQIQSNLIGLYDSQIDNIEILDANNFNQVVYNNDLNASHHRIIKATFVEFYAHWCGGCRRYARHWKNLAKETKLWHRSVIRVAAINCGDYRNEILCRQHNIQYYPTLKLFPAYAKFENKNQDGLLVKDNQDNLEHLMETMILFIEMSANKPPQWPNLEPYKSKTLNSLFIDNYNKPKFALLVFESDNSMIGRKLILDLSSFSNNIIIRRIVPTSNPNLTNKFAIDTNRLPILYLVKNTHSTMMKYELFDQKLVEYYQKEYFKLISNQNITISEEIKNENEHIRFKKMIFKFIEYANLIEKEETRLKQNSSIDAFKNENKSHKHRIYLEDLETGLNIMLRSDIAKKQFINGSEMIALKNWIRVLTKVLKLF